MKLILGVSLLMALMGCCRLPKYDGEGQITRTTAWHDGLVRIPEYTVHLASFNLSTNFDRSFRLGNLAFFRRSTVSVQLCFIDDHTWSRFSDFPNLGLNYAEIRERDIDPLCGAFRYRVETADGNVLAEVNKPLKKCTWGQSQRERPLWRVEIYDRDNVIQKVQRQQDLRLWFSYSGDPSLTNTAELLVICRPE